MSGGRVWGGWDVIGSPTLTFAYRIPPGLSVQLRAATPYGDWVVLGQTRTADTAPAGAWQIFVDDGAWHEAAIDVATLLRGELPGIRQVTELEYVAQRAQSGAQQFWIDDVTIAR